jgi:OOP family OmpA-OmpF porin
MKNIGTVAGCAILSCAVASVRANDPGSWYLTPQIGYVWTDFQRQVDNAAIYGLGLGYQLTPDYGLELNVLRSEHTFERGGHLDLSALMLDGIILAPDQEPFTPFMTMGIGVIRDNPDPIHSQDAFAAQLGGGLQLQVLKSGTFAFNVVPQLRIRWDSNGFPNNRDMYEWIATIGFQWVWGNQKAAAVHLSAQTPPVAQPAINAPPLPLDSDGDRVPDSRDRCPGTPRGVAVDEYGCPRKGSVTLHGVNFELDSATLTSDSRVTLDAVAADLLAHPRLKVELQGHTDSSGSSAYNQALSQRRADSVSDYLVIKGVSSSQVSAKGYGETQPIADNATTTGRTQNRRVVMTVLDNPGNLDVRVESARPE